MGEEFTTKAAQEYIDRTPISFLQCRAWQHTWNLEAGQVERTGRTYLWEVPCTVCGAVKTRMLSSDGKIMRSSYKYPNGYLAAGEMMLDEKARGMVRLSVLEEYS